MKRQTVIMTVLAMGCGIVMVGSGSATAVDYSDTTPPTLVSVEFEPNGALRGQETEIGVTVIVSDNANALKPIRLGELIGCESPTYTQVAIQAPYQLLQRDVATSGVVTETWVNSITIPPDARVSDYWFQIEGVTDQAGNSTTLAAVGSDCRPNYSWPVGTLRVPTPLFTVVDGSVLPEPVEPVANQLIALQSRVEALESDVDELTSQNQKLETRYDALKRKYEKKLNLIEKLKVKLKR